LTDQIDMSIPQTTSPEDVLRWTLVYLGGFANTVNQMTEILATEAQVESHPKALVTLRRRAAMMQDYSAQLKAYLDERQHQQG
jgi:hypothetical protein